MDSFVFVIFRILCMHYTIRKYVARCTRHFLTNILVWFNIPIEKSHKPTETNENLASFETMFDPIVEKLIVFNKSNVRDTPTKRTKRAVVKRENSCGHILHSGIIYAPDMLHDRRGLPLIFRRVSLYSQRWSVDHINPLIDSAEFAFNVYSALKDKDKLNSLLLHLLI